MSTTTNYYVPTFRWDEYTESTKACTVVYLSFWVEIFLCNIRQFCFISCWIFAAHFSFLYFYLLLLICLFLEPEMLYFQKIRNSAPYCKTCTVKTCIAGKSHQWRLIRYLFLFFQEEEPQEVDEESGKEETEEQEIPDWKTWVTLSLPHMK